MDPLPNELVMDAWKAKVGYSFDRERTQDAYHESAMTAYIAISIRAILKVYV